MSRRESSKRIDVCIGIRDSILWVHGSTTHSNACGDASNNDASDGPSSLYPQHRRRHYRAPTSKSSNPSSSNVPSEHTPHPAIPRLLAPSPPIMLPSAQTPPPWKQHLQTHSTGDREFADFNRTNIVTITESANYPGTTI